MIKGIFASTKHLEKSLDLTWKRNEVISHNIANVDTPGYKKKAVTFEEQLLSVLPGHTLQGKQTRRKHLRVGNVPFGDINPKIVETDQTKMRIDGNNVDIDSEMSALATNTLMHHALVQKLNNEFSRLKSIINEGRR